LRGGSAWRFVFGQLPTRPFARPATLRCMFYPGRTAAPGRVMAHCRLTRTPVCQSVRIDVGGRAQIRWLLALFAGRRLEHALVAQGLCIYAERTFPRRSSMVGGVPVKSSAPPAASLSVHEWIFRHRGRFAPHRLSGCNSASVRFSGAAGSLRGWSGVVLV